MLRTLLLVSIVLAAACGPSAPGTGAATALPTRTPDIGRAKVDVAYSAIADQHYAAPTSRELLTAALDAFRQQAKSVGATVDVATPEFSDASEPVLADFKRFADAASVIAAATPQVTGARLADAAVVAMLNVKPDCHAYYRTASGAVVTTLPARSGARPPVTRPDAAGLEARMIGSLGYVTWREFRSDGTYDITTQVRKALDGLVAQGARGWIFDLRGNGGGDPPQTMISWFLNGEPIYDIRTRTGSAGVASAKAELRLPDAYQLPMAVILNGAGGSSPEVFTLGLKENRRAVIVGQRSVGCLGSIQPLTLADGSFLAVPSQSFVGAVTGARYNNVGIPPDVLADDARAVDVAVGVVTDLIRTGRLFP